MSWQDVRGFYQEPDDWWFEGAPGPPGPPPEPAPCWWCQAVLPLEYGGRFCCDSCSLAWCRWSQSQIDSLPYQE
jgi:hypothetical protein